MITFTSNISNLHLPVTVNDGFYLRHQACNWRPISRGLHDHGRELRTMCLEDERQRAQFHGEGSPFLDLPKIRRENSREPAM